MHVIFVILSILMLSHYFQGIGFDQESNSTESYYLAFLAYHKEFTPPTPPSPIQSHSEEKYKNSDEQDGFHLWKEKLDKNVADSDSEEEASLWDARQSLGLRTAGDGSDNPDDPIPAPAGQVLSFQRVRSGAIFKKYLPNNLLAPESLAANQPAPRSKSMEEIASVPSTSKFQFKPQKILEVAKRIGQGNRSESLENLDTLSTSKKPGTFKKSLKENSVPILGANPKKRKFASSTELLLHPEEPCIVSRMDQPSNPESGSHMDRSSAGSDLQCPLSETILALLCELLKEHRSWLTIDRVQQAFMAIFGGLFEWYGMGYM